MSEVAPPVRVARIFTGLAGEGPHELMLRRSGLRFQVRGPMDAWAVKETVIDRLYQRYGFVVEPGWAVVDIGAGIGDFAVLAAAQGARVVAFEPFSPSCALLRENARRNGLDIDSVEAAVSGTTGEVALDIGLPDPIYLRTSAERLAGGATIAVPALSLADALDRAGWGRVHLLKLDCEGAEHDILGSADRVTLGRVERIVLEYHEWDGHTHAELEHLLRAAGNVVQSAPNPTYPGIGYLRAWRPPA